MTQRPLNECLNCGKTWYPRGQDLSEQCSRCRSRDVRIVPTLAPPPLPNSSGGVAAIIIGGVLLLAFCGLGTCGLFLGGAGQRGNQEPEQPQARFNEPARNTKNEDVEKPKTVRPDKFVNAPEKNPKKLAPEELPPPAPPSPIPPTIQAPSHELAPPPRVLPLNRPPAGVASVWERCGEIETRIVGASIIRPVLVKNEKEEEPAPEPYLVIWVETRCRPAGRAALRRWQGTFSDTVTLTDANNAQIEPAKLPTESWLGGQLKGEHSLKPGGPGGVDVLAFKMPPTSARNLWLSLGASHVRESGKFFHAIPHEMWSRK